MGEKIDIDGVRFKVEADLSKLEADLKKGESTAKKGGEGLGHAAGKGFAGTLKSNTNSALNSIENQAGSMGSKVSGVFTKIGVAAAAAFAVDKVITFFKSAVDEAEKAEKASGKVGKGAADSFKKAEADIDEAIVNIKKTIGGPLLSLVRTLYDAVATVLGGITKIVNKIADAFTTKDAEQIAAAYQKQRNELRALGSEMDRLSSINKRTAEEELQLAKLKETLADRAQKLGINYAELTQKTKSYKEQLQEVERIERAQAKAEVGRLGASLQGGLGYLEQRRDELKADMARARSRGDRQSIIEINKEILELGPRIERQKRTIDETIKRFKDMDAPLKEEAKAEAPGAPVSGGQSAQEARFLDSRLRLVTIEENRAYTIKKAIRETNEGKERERRIAMANEEARQAVEYELGSLRAGYAQFIEETHMAKLEAIKSEADNARRMSYNLLEAELKQAGTNEEKLQKAKESNAKRIGDIKEAQARKEANLTLESYVKTLQAANATTTGLANIANAKNAGGAIGGAGGLLSGASGFSDKLKGLGIVGTGISAIGGIISTVTDLFGKSEAERQREAEEQKRRDEAALKIFELQASYQRQQLELAQANAKLPFENLTRQLRLIDIEAGKQRLSGVDEATVNSTRLSARSSAIQGVLSSQANTIGGGQLFGGQGSSAEALTGFLSERAAQSVSVAHFMSLVQAMAAGGDMSVMNEYARQAQTFKGRIPDQLFSVIEPFLASIATYNSLRNSGASIGETSGASINVAGAATRAFNLAQGINSEISSDTGIAENLLSVIEQDQQTQLEIAQNTKKTAENTTKLVETPQRQSSIIDISRGYTRSLGQVLNPGITNTALPASVKAAVLATDIQKSIQERSLDKLQNIETIQRDSRELLAIIAKGVNSTASGSLLAELESLYRRSIAA